MRACSRRSVNHQISQSVHVLIHHNINFMQTVLVRSQIGSMTSFVDPHLQVKLFDELRTYTLLTRISSELGLLDWALNSAHPIRASGLRNYHIRFCPRV